MRGHLLVFQRMPRLWGAGWAAAPSIIGSSTTSKRGCACASGWRLAQRSVISMCEEMENGAGLPLTVQDDSGVGHAPAGGERVGGAVAADAQSYSFREHPDAALLGRS